MRHSKLLVTGMIVSAITAFSAMFSYSYSASNPLEFAEFLKSNSGYSTITVSGESSKTITPDAAVLVLAITNPPSDIEDAMERYNQNVKNVTANLEQELENFDEVSISYIQTSFDGNHYNYGGIGQQNDSFVAYMSFPVKVSLEKYQGITQDISNLGLRIEDIRISKIPTSDPVEKKAELSTIAISVPHGTSMPSCEISNECYLPAEITIQPGSEVVWTNDDEAAHTITSGSPSSGPDGIFDSALFMSNTTFSYVFDTPGEFPYFCMVHPWMVGTVTVAGETSSNVKYTLEATINVRLETKPDTLENTLTSYTKTLDELTTLLEENGISGEIPRSSININPSYYPQGVFDSYQTYSRWTVKTPVERLDLIYSILSKYGGIERIYLSPSESSIDMIRKGLTQEALDDAKSRVIEIIEPMNLEIKGIKTIKVNQNISNQHNSQWTYSGVIVSLDEWNNIRDGNISVMVDVEFEVGK